jgi:hypothetical protein
MCPNQLRSSQFLSKSISHCFPKYCCAPATGRYSSHYPCPPSQEELAARASEQILEDDTLLPGDLVSTNRGLLQFGETLIGIDASRDFVRVC